MRFSRCDVGRRAALHIGLMVAIGPQVGGPLGRSTNFETVGRTSVGTRYDSIAICASCDTRRSRRRTKRFSTSFHLLRLGAACRSDCLVRVGRAVAIGRILIKKSIDGQGLSARAMVRATPD